MSRGVRLIFYEHWESLKVAFVAAWNLENQKKKIDIDEEDEEGSEERRNWNCATVAAVVCEKERTEPSWIFFFIEICEQEILN